MVCYLFMLHNNHQHFSGKKGEAAIAQPRRPRPRPLPRFILFGVFVTVKKVPSFLPVFGLLPPHMILTALTRT